MVTCNTLAIGCNMSFHNLKLPKDGTDLDQCKMARLLEEFSSFPFLLQININGIHSEIRSKAC
ncbi:hypothetical protein P5673_026391 [Acropora cervicornis]|uniref:Uncharacterized protein n=1 Tax=Acropora cervicornis TaxID=6130 RepID=A0AAD9Q0N4_ACRCE|nr:hypothetical protein P5673_026391 [Acropora cervicornis]